MCVCRVKSERTSLKSKFRVGQFIRGLRVLDPEGVIIVETLHQLSAPVRSGLVG